MSALLWYLFGIPIIINNEDMGTFLPLVRFEKMMGVTMETVKLNIAEKSLNLGNSQKSVLRTPGNNLGPMGKSQKGGAR